LPRISHRARLHRRGFVPCRADAAHHAGRLPRRADHDRKDGICMTPQEDALFHQRLARHHDELRWLYMELYDNGSMFAELCDQMYRYAEARSAALKARDAAREADPNWYKHRDLLGMMLYIDNFAGNLDRS